MSTSNTMPRAEYTLYSLCINVLTFILFLLSLLAGKKNVINLLRNGEEIGDLGKEPI